MYYRLACYNCCCLARLSFNLFSIFLTIFRICRPCDMQLYRFLPILTAFYRFLPHFTVTYGFLPILTDFYRFGGTSSLYGRRRNSKRVAKEQCQLGGTRDEGVLHPCFEGIASRRRRDIVKILPAVGRLRWS